MSFAFNVVKLNGSVLTGIEAPTYDRREERLKAGNDGALHTTTATVIRAAPRAGFATVAVRALLVLLGTGDEVPYVALNGTTGLELIGAQRGTDGVGYAAGTVHPSRLGASGAVFLSGLSWRPRAPMSATVDAFWISAAGGTDPITVSAGVALPTLGLNQEQLGLSSLLIGATDLTNKCAAIDVAIDHRAENNVDPTCFNAGLPFPVQLAGIGVNGHSDVTVTIDTEDLTTAITNGAVVITGKVYNHLGVGFGATGITVTINGVLAREEAIPGENGATAKRRLVITGTFDGTNKPITVATF